MRYVRYAFWVPLGIVLISVSLANSAIVDLKLMPDAVAELLGFNPSISLPLFVVVLGGIATGLIVGFVWEWIREHKHRRAAGGNAREVRKLSREVNKLKTQKNAGKDEVLAILEDAN
ncbi:DUF1049 domain-containing protein [Sedimentitalea sp. CY04]|uniref:DUF1049 domain-containing protein n=1 Tax=Parasedimentitalea denitrificans TaxID=2211118 RepID=A0ABX0W958_9RHOB|nr:LapA family protein [Sedimentitalea sp. CY04]NIZ62137.1 DUF1049 domain-containing protein [Sedimentitalea sp. CY04]